MSKISTTTRRMTSIRRWKHTDKMLLLERLELYLSAGLALDKALLVAGECSQEWQRASVERVRQDVISGVRVSRSMHFSIGMPETVVGLIEHGESSGELSYALRVARELMEKSDALKKKCISALIYPSVIGVSAVALIIGLVRGVMPQIIPMLNSMRVELPFLTRLVMSLSGGISQYGLHILVAGISVVFVLYAGYTRTRIIRKAAHYCLMRTPLFGTIITAYSWSLFTRSCGTLIDTGVPAAHAFQKTVAYIPLYPLRDRLIERIPTIHAGTLLGSVLRDMSPYIPLYVPSLVSAGESSGSLGISLVRAATIIDRDLDHTLKKLTSLIEPIMMAGMGVAVGAIALSIMMPIYDMSRALQR